jgi:hypothetical protein
MDCTRVARYPLIGVSIGDILNAEEKPIGEKRLAPNSKKVSQSARVQMQQVPSGHLPLILAETVPTPVVKGVKVGA